MVRWVFAGLLLGVGSLGACAGKSEGSSDGEGGESAKPPVKTPPKPSPPQQCATYASTWCNKAFGCYVQVGRLDQGSLQYNVDQCTQLIIDKLPCSAATGSGEDFDKCISQVKGMACSKWNVPQVSFASVVPPSSCDSALSFE
jgi:hypothetical protein